MCPVVVDGLRNSHHELVDIGCVSTITGRWSQPVDVKPLNLKLVPLLVKILCDCHCSEFYRPL